MGYMSHYGVVSDEVIDQLHVGDFVFTQRLDSIWSWGMMYFTASSVDHCGIYAGDGQLLHMTLGEPKTHHLNTIARGARVVLARPTIDAREISQSLTRPDGGVIDMSAKFSHRFPPKVQLICRAIELIFGVYADRYRWRILADIVLVALMIDAPLCFAWHLLVALPIAAVIAIITAFNVGRYKLGRRANKSYRMHTHPDLHYGAIFSGGGVLFAGYETYALGSWGIIPMGLLVAFMKDNTLDCPPPEGAEASAMREFGGTVRAAVKRGEFRFLSQNNQENLSETLMEVRDSDFDYAT